MYLRAHAPMKGGGLPRDKGQREDHSWKYDKDLSKM